MAYRVAGIDVHKEMLALVVADVEEQGEYQFERRRYGSNPEKLRRMSAWLVEQQVEEAVMESTAQYWQPVWGALERYWKPEAAAKSAGLHLAQAQSNRGHHPRFSQPPQQQRSNFRPWCGFFGFVRGLRSLHPTDEDLSAGAPVLGVASTGGRWPRGRATQEFR